MGIISIHDRQLRSVALATLGAIAAAAATMFVPTSVLETVTGATGLSEMISATRAPLGDTARALIAFGTGALVLVCLSALLLRQKNPPAIMQIDNAEPAFEQAADENMFDVDDEPRPSLLDRIKALPFPKMPWVKGEDDVTELADLYRFRKIDLHPDAPYRPPLSAVADLPVFDLPVTAIVAPVVEEQKAEAAPAKTPDPEAMAAIVRDHEPSLAEMVAKLEAVMAKRQAQLDALEEGLRKAAAEAPAAHAEQTVVEEEPVAEEIEVPVQNERSPLEAVPSFTVKPEEMDDALRAALETLHRMNGTTH